jgi:hypothetical protein
MIDRETAESRREGRAAVAELRREALAKGWRKISIDHRTGEMREAGPGRSGSGLAELARAGAAIAAARATIRAGREEEAVLEAARAFLTGV